MNDNSHAVAGRLARLDRTTVFLATLAAVGAGLFIPGWLGAGVLGVLVGGLAVVARLTWAVTPPPMRLARMVILVGLAVVAAAKVI